MYDWAASPYQEQGLWAAVGSFLVLRPILQYSLDLQVFCQRLGRDLWMLIDLLKASYPSMGHRVLGPRVEVCCEAGRGHRAGDIAPIPRRLG